MKLFHAISMQIPAFMVGRFVFTHDFGVWFYVFLFALVAEIGLVCLQQVVHEKAMELLSLKKEQK